MHATGCVYVQIYVEICRHICTYIYIYIDRYIETRFGILRFAAPLLTQAAPGLPAADKVVLLKVVAMHF